MAAGEECDDGGFCYGNSKAGSTCTSDADCCTTVGCTGASDHGVCDMGTEIDTECASDNDCPGGTCVRCRPVGGDGCAANCTTEAAVILNLSPYAGFGVPQHSYAAVKTDSATINVALTGSITLQSGKERNGLIPVAGKLVDVKLPAIKVGTLACACVRGVEAKSCGGTVFDMDGLPSLDCTFDNTLCATNGKNPCASIHGPGNSSSGVVGCGAGGIEGVNLTYSQDAGGLQPAGTPTPVPPTPWANSGPAMIMLSGTGGAGSMILVNTSRIGTGQASIPQFGTNQCVETDTVKPNPIYGQDKIFCTADDPDTVAARGSPSTIPLVTGMATAVIHNHVKAGIVQDLGPVMFTGVPIDCATLTQPTPAVASGTRLVGAFTTLNSPVLGDTVVGNQFETK